MTQSTQPPRLLRLDTSLRGGASVSRDLTDRIVARFGPEATVVTRDLAKGDVPLIDTAWIDANVIPADARSPEQTAILALSDHLVAELQAADILVIGLPIYNFGVPAALKAWIDQVARAGITFRYTEAGPQGLLTGKRAIVAMASAGTEAGSEIDFATGYLRHVLGFMGITDVTFVTADRMMLDAEATLSRATAQVAALEIAA
jgi:FMN-dependent NADH-azoreductase